MLIQSALSSAYQTSHTEIAEKSEHASTTGPENRARQSRRIWHPRARVCVPPRDSQIKQCTHRSHSKRQPQQRPREQTHPELARKTTDHHVGEKATTHSDHPYYLAASGITTAPAASYIWPRGSRSPRIAQMRWTTGGGRMTVSAGPPSANPVSSLAEPTTDHLHSR